MPLPLKDRKFVLWLSTVCYFLFIIFYFYMQTDWKTIVPFVNVRRKDKLEDDLIV